MNRYDRSWTNLRIVERKLEGPDIVRLDLAPIGGDPLPAFEAGAHIDVKVSDKIRQYSLYNAPYETEAYRIAVRREANGRGGSRQIYDEFLVGVEVMVRGPRNLFKLASERHTALLLAGGIGITPVLSMADELDHRKWPFVVHVFNRASAPRPFEETILAKPWAEVVDWHDGNKPPNERTPVGELIGSPHSSRRLYVCGSGKFIANVTAAALDRGWDSSNIVVEQFSSKGIEKGVDRPFLIQVGSTGQLVEVPAGTSAVEALRDVGIEIPVSCSDGFCGTCITRVLDGVPEHRDAILSEEEHARNDVFTPCCSRSLSDVITLDL